MSISITLAQYTSHPAEVMRLITEGYTILVRNGEVLCFTITPAR